MFGEIFAKVVKHAFYCANCRAVNRNSEHGVFSHKPPDQFVKSKSECRRNQVNPIAPRKMSGYVLPLQDYVRSRKLHS